MVIGGWELQESDEAHVRGWGGWCDHSAGGRAPVELRGDAEELLPGAPGSRGRVLVIPGKQCLTLLTSAQ